MSLTRTGKLTTVCLAVIATVLVALELACGGGENGTPVPPSPTPMPVPTPTPTLSPAQDIERQVDALLESVLTMDQKQIPFSGCVLIAGKGEVLVRKCYGMADRENQVATTLQTRFPLGAMTEQFTAMAIMQLQERGLLSVEDSINKFLPDYTNGDKITIHHLLTHTSGIPIQDLEELPGLENKTYTAQEVVDRFKDARLSYEPGSRKYDWSNMNGILLSLIVEKVSNQSFESFLQENIFQPLVMGSTGYSHPKNPIQECALGYKWQDDEYVQIGGVGSSSYHGSAALWSTIENLYLWDRALYTDKLVSTETIETMFEPQAEVSGGQVDRSYGWYIDRLSLLKMVRDKSEVVGYSVEFQRFVDDDVTIIQTSNIECDVLKTGAGLRSIAYSGLQ